MVIPHAEICGAGNRRFSPDREYIPVGQCPAERKCLNAFLVLVAALLLLAPAWRWMPLQDWLSPQRVAESIRAFPRRAGAR